MTKFEYCIYTHALILKKGSIYFPNGDTLDTSGETMMKVINDLGTEEWELVSVINLENIESFHFKRALKK
jgi:hypothetical protein